EHVGGRDLAVALERPRVTFLVRDVLDRESRGGAARHRDAPRVEIDAPDEARRTRRGVVEREQAEAAADVEHRSRRRQILADLVEKALAQDPEPNPAVGPYDRIVVGADHTPDDVSAHTRCSRRVVGRPGTPRAGAAILRSLPPARSRPAASRARTARRTSAGVRRIQ